MQSQNGYTLKLINVGNDLQPQGSFDQQFQPGHDCKIQLINNRHEPCEVTLKTNRKFNGLFIIEPHSSMIYVQEPTFKVPMTQYNVEHQPSTDPFQTDYITENYHQSFESDMMIEASFTPKLYYQTGIESNGPDLTQSTNNHVTHLTVRFPCKVIKVNDFPPEPIKFPGNYLYSDPNEFINPNAHSDPFIPFD